MWRNYFPMSRELWTTLFFVSFLSTYRKLSYGNVYRSCCCMDILISSLYSNDVFANGLYVWISILSMRSSKIGSSLMFRISSQMLCTANPKDFKNVTFDKLLLLLLFAAAGWASVIELWHHWPCKECVISLHTLPYEHLTLALSLSPSYVQSNGDLFSSKIEQSSVLVDDAYC